MCDWGVDVPRKPLPPQTTSFFFAGEAIGRRGGVLCGEEDGFFTWRTQGAESLTSLH